MKLRFQVECISCAPRKIAHAKSIFANKTRHKQKLSSGKHFAHSNSSVLKQYLDFSHCVLSCYHWSFVSILSTHLTVSVSFTSFLTVSGSQFAPPIFLSSFSSSAIECARFYGTGTWALSLPISFSFRDVNFPLILGVCRAVERV